jgi:predicted phosphodiesterase
MKTALFSDIHGNTPALEAVLEDIRREGVDQVFVLGDIIHGIDPHGCVRRLDDWSATQGVPLHCIKGNAEMYLLTPDLDNLPNRGEAWEGEVLRLYRWFQAQLSAEDIDWIRTFPDFLFWRGACLVHDAPADRLHPAGWHRPGIELKYQEWFHHSRGVMEDMPEPRWQALWDLMTQRGFTQVFIGHTHVPFQKSLDGKQVCNTGSVGASLDGDPRAAWALMEGQPDEKPAITLRRVAYDIARICQMVDAAPDYPDFSKPGKQEQYKRWRQTGTHTF